MTGCDPNCGGAIVLVYRDGLLVRQLHHEHDGGRAYMVPLLRQAVKYARTHYGAGDIVRVLSAEVELACGEEPCGCLTHWGSSNHLYYVKSRYNPRRSATEYEVVAKHARGLRGLDIPADERDIPDDAEKVI